MVQDRVGRRPQSGFQIVHGECSNIGARERCTYIVALLAKDRIVAGIGYHDAGSAIVSNVVIELHIHTQMVRSREQLDTHRPGDLGVGGGYAGQPPTGKKKNSGHRCLGYNFHAKCM